MRISKLDGIPEHRVPDEIAFERCPYWGVFDGAGGMTRSAVVIGCGGYGEVSEKHPAAGAQITEDSRDGFVCLLCHGTGMRGKPENIRLAIKTVIQRNLL